ncbi:unnamed protein product [Hymenolepis diminuta]|uniref:Bcl-2 Bcl-2 homology region 1-3 domain-containing protein n=2 Tax=Hymenolepis diminuta TaxID=6216 RepID=A0A564YAV4_HYMDI|nr:unnamed protein product [Hymenolepis diminuta]
MAILKSLFASQINWGRIVAMISFLRALCVILDTTPGSQSSSSSADDCTSENSPITNLQVAILHYLIWMTEFIHNESKLGEWIKEHGGWEGLEKFAHGGKSSIYSQFASIFVGASVLFAPSGLASAIGFFLHRLWSRMFE